MNSKQIIDTVGIHVERYLYINRVLNLFTNLIQLFTEKGFGLFNQKHFNLGKSNVELVNY